ncbi:glycoside hydrolase family 5 protein [Phytoactinopolyspora halotolerans]|uniref:Glycoside hydrolase family 5 protein n=2 Tax=Phytoactinopolyspora halotolerans TaxID=1981512 RepID=A0A6L9SHW0_9ACTN|nr:glycoside hydrolase family 5 protein [Phytoactinopolyspora halotolerans]
MRLIGVNRPGTEWPCAHGWGLIAGPSDDAAVAAIAAWDVNAVRVPLNEHCWLGINGVPAQYGGPAYRQFIQEWVARINDAGMYAILDLHWSAPGSTLADGQDQMPNADHSVDFWRSVAQTFKDHDAVVFDLFNEAHDVSDACWRNGCMMPEGWEAVGMQDLVDTVRAAGATQPLIVNCNGWGNDCSGWLQYRPSDPLNSIIAGAHVYDYTSCNTQPCWQAELEPIAGTVPFVFGEFGNTDCGRDFSDLLMLWSDNRGISYLPWGWYPGGCGFPGLIADWGGTPTSQFGQAFHDHVAGL